jgi:pimeloyl-ACP methyl ester carboxylesterase
VKPTLVLLPGLLCDHALWAPQIAALSDVCEPWIGDLTRSTSIADMAARVLEEVPASTFALAGLSMGGYVALQIVRQAPERVTRLALLDTRARPDTPDESERRHTLMRIAQNAKGLAPINKRMLPLLVHPSRSKEPTFARVVDEMADRVGLAAYLRQQTAILDRGDFRPDLPKIGCSTLILCGRQDALTPPAFHDEMAALIPGSRQVAIDECGHLSTLERPAEVNAGLRAWLIGQPELL